MMLQLSVKYLALTMTQGHFQSKSFCTTFFCEVFFLQFCMEIILLHVFMKVFALSFFCIFLICKFAIVIGCPSKWSDITNSRRSYFSIE